MAAGDEILIVDGRETDRQGMKTLFEELGYVCTAVSDPAAARELVGRKFFPAALVDLDAGGPGVGLDTVRAIREISEPTAVVLLSGRRSFEGAVEALRLGVVDVVLKRPEEVERLKRAMSIALDRYRAGHEDGGLLKDAQAVLGEAFKILVALGRSRYADVSMASVAAFQPRFLVVDADTDFLQQLAERVKSRRWQVVAEMNGGAALDRTGGSRFDIVLSRVDLVDLPGPMVVRTIQAQHVETLGLVYSAPGPEGRMDVYREGELQRTVRPFHHVDQLVAQLEVMIGQVTDTLRDRRVIQAFRSEHESFFRRYAELKLRIDRLLG